MADAGYPTTVAAAVTAVRANLNEATASFWSDVEIQNWILLGCVHLCTIGLALENNANVTLANGTLEYSVPTGVKRIFAAIYNGGSGAYYPLIKINLRQFRHVQSSGISGQPVYFYSFAEKVGFWPVPGASQASKTVAVYGYKVSDDLTEIPREFRPAVIEFATAMALWKDRRNGDAAQAYGRFVALMEALKDGVADEKTVSDSLADRIIPVATAR